MSAPPGARRRMADALRRLVAPAATPQSATVRAVVAEGFFTRLGFGIVTFALPLYALELGMSLAEVGLLAGAKALVVPVVKPIMGVVVDRFGARRGYLAAVAIRFLGALLLLVATSPGMLLGVRFLQGAASAARDPAAISVLAKQSRKRLGRTFSAAIGAKDLGNVSAGLVGGGVLAATGGRFPVLWVLVCVLAAVPVVAVWRGVRDVDADPPPADDPAGAAPAGPGSTRAGGITAGEPGAADAPRAAAPAASGVSSAGGPAPAPGGARILRDPRLRLIAGLGCLAGLTAHMTHGLFQVYASEVAGLDAGQIGLIYSTSVATLLVFGPAAGWAADRFGTGPLAGVRGVANAVSSMVFLFFPVLGGVFAGRVVDDVGKAAFRPTWGTLVAGATRDAGPRGGRVAAGLDTALSVGEALGPLVAGLIWDWYGLAAFFGVRAVLGVGTELLLGRRLRAAAPDPVATSA